MNMKREYIAVFLIVSIFVLSMMNIRYIENKTQALEGDIETAEKLYFSGDKEGAVSDITASLDAWLSWDSYSHIMLRHSEIDIITDAYYDLLSELQCENETPEASFEKVKEELRSIATKERITLGSIL